MVAKDFNFDINLCGNEIQNGVFQNLATSPTSNLKGGRFWYDTANKKPMFYDGTAAKEFGKDYTQGTGISINGTTIAIDTTVVAQKSDIPTNYVPTSRTVNGKALSTNISLTASDVGALADSTKYGATFDLSLDETNYKLTITLKDQDGTALGTQTVDFPIESVVVGGSYDDANEKIILTLKNGSTIDIPVGGLVSGLQAEITSTNKLSADLISDGTTNKVVTATEKNTWNGKQDALGYTPCKKLTATNTALTASSGVCTWTITNTIASEDVLVQVRNASTGAIVEVAALVTSSTVTIKMNSTSNIAAGTYKAVIIG